VINNKCRKVDMRRLFSAVVSIREPHINPRVLSGKGNV
jgi:hypothetical protein